VVVPLLVAHIWLDLEDLLELWGYPLEPISHYFAEGLLEHLVIDHSLEFIWVLCDVRPHPMNPVLVGHPDTSGDHDLLVRELDVEARVLVVLLAAP